MYELFKIVSVIAIILWALRDKIDEPRNIKYCCNKANETKVKSSSIESFTIEVPRDDDTPAARLFIADETPVIDMPAAESIVELSTVELSTVELSTVELSTIDMPAAESTVDMPAAESIVESFTFDVPNDAPSDDEAPAPQPFVVYETPVIELSIVELSTIDDMPAAESTTVDMPAAESTTVDMPAAESTVDMPAAESTVDMPAAESTDDELSTIDDDKPEEVVSIEDLYGDYMDLLMPSIMLRLSNNTSVNNTFVSRNICFGVVHASI